MKGCLTLAVISFIALSVMGSAPARASSLEDELRLLVETHPKINAERKKRSAASEETNKAYSAYLPTIDLYGDAGMEHVANPTRRALDESSENPYNRGRETTKFTVTENLYSGGVDGATLNRAAAGELGASHTLSTTTQDTLLEGIAAYLEVIRQAQLLELSRNNAATIRQQLSLEDERVRRGSGITVDVLTAKQRLQKAMERIVAFEGALANAQTQFIQVFNHGPETDTMEPPPIPLDLMPKDLQEAIDIALVENPAVGKGEADVEQAYEDRASAKSGYLPTLDLVFEHNYESDKNTVIGIRRDWTLLLKANWNLFNGLSTRASVAKAALDHASSMDLLSHTRRKIVESARLAWQSIVTEKRRLDLLDNAVNIASEIYVSRSKLREAGKETLINVLDAENAIYEAQINQVSTAFDHLIANFKLLHAMGRLQLAHLYADPSPPSPTTGDGAAVVPDTGSQGNGEPQAPLPAAVPNVESVPLEGQ